MTVAARADGSRADYDRSKRLPEITRNTVFRAKVQAHWLSEDGRFRRFWYRNDLPNDAREFILVDAEQGVRGAAFDHARMAAVVSAASGKEVRSDRLPVTRIEPGAGGSLVARLSVGGKGWECDLATYAVRPAAAAPDDGQLPATARPHPSRRTGEETTVTFLNRTVGEVTLYWIDTEGERHRYAILPPGGRHEQHTFGGHVWLATDAAGAVLGVFEAADEPGTAVIDGKHLQPNEDERPRPAAAGVPSPDGRWTALVKEDRLFVRDAKSGEELPLGPEGTHEDYYDAGQLFWAPDSRKVVALRTKRGADHKVYLIESSPPDQVQPKLHSFEYLKPGDAIPQAKPHLFDVPARREIPVADTLFPNPWSLDDVRWSRDSQRFTFLYNQRGHQVLRVIAVDATSGAARAIIDERSKTFIDYAGKFFCRYLDATDEILWMSERDGWNHLYLYDAKTGAVKSQVTRGDWVVRGVDRVDEEKRQVWFRAGGIVPGEDPYYVHYCRVNFDGTGLLRLTDGDGTHAVEFSPDRRFLIDTWSRVDQPPVTELRRADDGRRVCELERADWPALLATGWKPPERFVAKGRDGKTDIYGVLYRPTNFDASRKYPVVEDLYAGPQSLYVPKEFRPLYGPQAVAELGFIVVQIDGMGTSNRSKAFHDVCWKNLGDAGLPDRILWMQAAARSRPWMDLSQVGVYGVSAGAQSSMRALIAHPEFYKVAVSACGCHDNRMDKIWWNELWMGWPVGPEYAEQSNVTQAHRMQGKLLLIVGELDHNVDPASTMQVVNALIKADKDFELLVVPGADHGMGGEYGTRRMEDFLVKNLLHVEPRHD